MEDKNLVNKPVKVKQIIEALRCVESDGLAGHCYCETCPFAEKVKLSNLAFVERCNFDGILKSAADRLSNDQRHITALQKEIERLRGCCAPASTAVYGYCATIILQTTMILQ